MISSLQKPAKVDQSILCMIIKPLAISFNFWKLHLLLSDAFHPLRAKFWQMGITLIHPACHPEFFMWENRQDYLCFLRTIRHHCSPKSWMEIKTGERLFCHFPEYIKKTSSLHQTVLDSWWLRENIHIAFLTAIQKWFASVFGVGWGIYF